MLIGWILVGNHRRLRRNRFQNLAWIIRTGKKKVLIETMLQLTWTSIFLFWNYNQKQRWLSILYENKWKMVKYGIILFCANQFWCHFLIWKLLFLGIIIEKIYLKCGTETQNDHRFNTTHDLISTWPCTKLCLNNTLTLIAIKYPTW